MATEEMQRELERINQFAKTPLTAEQEKRLTAALEKKTGKTIVLTSRVDPSLVGGMRVEMDGKRYDNTVASKMEHLRRALLS